MSHALGTTLVERVEAVRESVRIAAERSRRPASAVTIVAVSKTAPRSRVSTAYDLGLRHFGENRVAEASAKLAEPLPSDCTLHMIGQLQSNKAARALELFDVIESVDRLPLIDALQSRSEQRGIMLAVLLQVNVAGESQKAGCLVADVDRLARGLEASRNLDFQGVMTMAPLVDDPETVRPVFRGLRELRDRIAQVIGRPLPVLSMGMSNDYEVAISEGASHVRIGRAIFG
jgi:pyridoxal phosphate enzyme (YggS family)